MSPDVYGDRRIVVFIWRCLGVRMAPSQLISTPRSLGWDPDSVDQLVKLGVVNRTSIEDSWFKFSCHGPQEEQGSLGSRNKKRRENAGKTPYTHEDGDIRFLMDPRQSIPLCMHLFSLH